MLAYLDIHSHLTPLPLFRKDIVKKINNRFCKYLNYGSAESFLQLVAIKKYFGAFANIYTASWKAHYFVLWLDYSLSCGGIDGKKHKYSIKEGCKLENSPLW